MTPELWLGAIAVGLTALAMLIAGIASHVTLKNKIDVHERDIERLRGEVGVVTEIRASIGEISGKQEAFTKQLELLNEMLLRWLEPRPRRRTGDAS